jgi:hypothetical protein
LAVGDFNHDGKPDLVAGTRTGLDVLLGKGDGTFTLNQTISFARVIHGCIINEGVNSVAVSDLRGKGSQDVVALSSFGEVDVLIDNSTGTLQSPVQVDAGVDSFAVGDFNGDGKPDIVTSNTAQQFVPPSISFLAGKGDGTFAAPTTVSIGETAGALTAGDFRGTGKLDLVMAGANTVTVLPGNGNGSFLTAPTVATNNAPDLIAAADFNGDGKPDLVTAGLGETLVVLLNNGDGSFRLGTSIALNGFPTALAVGDFLGNGKQDIAVALGGTIDIFLGNGNGTFQAPKVINLGDVSITSLVAGVFTKGALPDLAATVLSLASGTEATVAQVLHNAGKGTFTKAQSISVGTDAEGLAAADFNGDGKLDLVTTSFLPDGTRNVEVLLGNGNSTFQKPVITTPSLSGRFIAAGDFNGDGKADLVLVDIFSVDNTVMVLRGNGNGTFGNPFTLKFQNQLGGATPVVGDFFGDGKLSIAVVTAGGLVTVLRGNGDGTFQAPVNFLTDSSGTQDSALVAADFNGDGKLDLAATDSVSNDVTVLLNTTPPHNVGAPVNTSTALASDATTAVFGQPVTLTATVTAATGTATGSITFFDGTTRLGEVALDPNGQARLLVQLAPGSHTLQAVFAGIAPFKNSSSTTLTETVNKDATTTTTLAAQKIICGEVLLTATVAPVAPGSGTPTGTVAFFDNGVFIGSATVDANGQATIFLGRTLATGQHKLTAIYDGDPDFLQSSSNAITITV